MFKIVPFAAFLLASLGLAQTPAPPAPVVSGQAARVQVAQETMQVRLLERSGQLLPLRPAASCADRFGKQKLTVLKDTRGITRVVRFEQRIPDNTVAFTGYFDAAGHLRYATGQASGYPGLLYNLTDEFDVQGNLIHEVGTRRPGQNGDLREVLGKHLEAWQQGQCLP